MATLKDLTPKHLQTKRLTLERFNHNTKHYTTFLTAMNSPTAYERMGDLGVRTASDFDAFNATCRLRHPKFRDGIADDDLYYVARLLSGDCIGGVSICQRLAGETVLPPDIGWCFLEEHMGKGYATEAATEVLKWAREGDLGLKEVIVFPSETNRQSNRVAEKLGFVDGGRIEDLDQPGGFMNVWILPGMEKLDIKEGVSIKLQ